MSTALNADNVIQPLLPVGRRLQRTDKDCMFRRRLATKTWDTERTEERRQQCREIQRWQKPCRCEDLYDRMDTKQGGVDLYMQDMQQVKVIKGDRSVMGRWTLWS